MKELDKTMVGVVIGLAGLGILMVYSSSFFYGIYKKQGGEWILFKQLMALGLGGILLLVVSKIDYHLWGKASYFILAVCVVLLGVTLIIGKEIHGVKRWLKVSGISFQPSEVAKLGLIIFISDYIARERVQDFKKGILPLFLPILIPLILIAMQPSFGVLAVISSTIFLLLFIGGAKIFHIIGLGGIVGIGGGLWLQQVQYAKMRITGFLGKESYQLAQSLLGIGCGGWWGKGLGRGQEKLLFLPESHTDFIFSIIGEELGLVGCLGVLLGFFFFLYQGVNIGINSRDEFGFLLAVGISLTIFISACLHIGVSCGLLPTTGLPLPFISAGGTNLVINMVSVGIVLSVARRSKRKNV